MMTMQWQLISTGGALLCAVIGSIHDLRERRIPNLLTGPAILAGLVVHSCTGHCSGFVSSAFAGLIAGGIGLIFFVAGGMGAGDVKLMTAVGCIAGVTSLHVLLISIAIAGGVFGIAVSIYFGRLRETLSSVGTLLSHHSQEGFKQHPYLNLDNPGTLRLPFALPIAAGCLITLCSLILEARP